MRPCLEHPADGHCAFTVWDYDWEMYSVYSDILGPLLKELAKMRWN
jgi:hypothetical protein